MKKNTDRKKPKNPVQQTRNTILRTISFEKEVFSAIEEARAKVGADRSEFVQDLCIEALTAREKTNSPAMPSRFIPQRVIRDVEASLKTV